MLSAEDEIEALQSLQFSLGTIKHATGDFSEENKLGEGGFGTVYKVDICLWSVKIQLIRTKLLKWNI